MPTFCRDALLDFAALALRLNFRPYVLPEAPCTLRDQAGLVANARGQALDAVVIGLRDVAGSNAGLHARGGAWVTHGCQ